MRYYLALHPTDRERASIVTLDDEAVRFLGHPQVNKVISGTPPNVVVEHLPDWTFVPTLLAPGEYYPRMVRASNDHLNDRPGINPGNPQTQALIETSKGQLIALREQLERIFRTVHPTPENLDVYGHDIRNVLILAATEVEAHWRGVLKANRASGQSTNDYVKLLPAMKLNEYGVRLPFYPWLSTFSPFQDWSKEKPTQSLAWYDAYNAIKHDRETLFGRGTLLHAIEAVCACYVMTMAQFGQVGVRPRQEINHFFNLETTPKWDVTEVYATLPGITPKPVPYPF
jgi:hypothetical protein